MYAFQILAQLDECKNIPDFNNYLAFILSQGDTLPVEVAYFFGFANTYLVTSCNQFCLSLPGTAKRRFATEEQLEAAVQGSARRVQTLCEGRKPNRLPVAQHACPSLFPHAGLVTFADMLIHVTIA